MSVTESCQLQADEHRKCFVINDPFARQNGGTKWRRLTMPTSLISGFDLIQTRLHATCSKFENQWLSSANSLFKSSQFQPLCKKFCSQCPHNRLDDSPLKVSPKNVWYIHLHLDHFNVVNNSPHHCGVFVFLLASRPVAVVSRPPRLCHLISQLLISHHSSHTTHLTQFISHTTHLTQFISHNSSHTIHVTHNSSHTTHLTHNSSHTTHLTQLISYTTHLTQLISHTIHLTQLISHTTHPTNNSSLTQLISHTTHLITSYTTHLTHTHHKTYLIHHSSHTLATT